MTDRSSLDALAELLDEVDGRLLVRFEDGTAYHLSGFAVAQDLDERTPHCAATIEEVVAGRTGADRFFEPGVGMFFCFETSSRCEPLREQESSGLPGSESSPGQGQASRLDTKDRES